MTSYFSPAPKPAGGKKSKKKSSKATKTTKTVNEAAVEERRKQNNRNRNQGKATERKVAAITGGVRVPASGAIKTSVWNLVGDVQVRDADGKRTIVLIECKSTSGINPKGDKTFVLKKSVLDQCTNEARQVGALGATWIHWLNANYEQDDYVVVTAQTFLAFLDAFKEVHKVEVVNDSESSDAD